MKVVASQSIAEQFFEYSSLYLEGKTVEKNLNEAKRLCKYAVDNGVIDAMYQYGKMLDEGIDDNKEEAYFYYKKAAEFGEANAINILSKLDKIEISGNAIAQLDEEKEVNTPRLFNAYEFLSSDDFS